MADNNLVLTIVLVVAAALLLSGNLTGFQVRATNAPGYTARGSYGTPAGSQLSNICYSDFFHTEIAEGDHLAKAVPSVEGRTYRVEVCRSGALKAFLCQGEIWSNKVLANIQVLTTDPINIGCRELNILNTVFPENF